MKWWLDFTISEKVYYLTALSLAPHRSLEYILIQTMHVKVLSIGGLDTTQRRLGAEHVLAEQPGLG